MFGQPGGNALFLVAEEFNGVTVHALDLFTED